MADRSKYPRQRPTEPPIPDVGGITIDERAFWWMIGSAKRRSDGDVEAEAELLADALAALPQEEIVGFQRVLEERMAETYNWDLWAAAYLINGGCSDDGFDYFRGWLIAQGERVYRDALRDPETLVNVADSMAECEAMLYVARQAHERATGHDLSAPRTVQPSEPSGTPWDEGSVGARLPRLAARFGAQRPS